MIVLGSGYPVLSCVLAYAALGKLGRLPGFVDHIAAYRLLPAVLWRPTAVLVIGIELITAGLLVPPATRTFGALVATGLLAAFLTAQAGAVARGLTVECGCFGVDNGRSTVGPVSIVRTALLLVMALGAAAAGGTAFHPVQLLIAPLLAAVVGLGPDLLRRRSADRDSVGRDEIAAQAVALVGQDTTVGLDHLS
jgi:hypothetical protein